MNLVTGSTGLVGVRLMHDLLRKGEKVRALRRYNSDLDLVRDVCSFLGNDLAIDQIDWVEGDILDVTSLEEAMEGIERVYHCAAVVSFHKADREQILKVNIDGTANVCNVALGHGVKKLCHISSTAAIGRRESGEWVLESNEWEESKLNSVYASSKYSAEQEVWRSQQEGLNVVVVNPSVIIGPGDITRSSVRLFGAVNKGMKYHPTGVNGFVALEDVSGACIRLMDSDISGERFIINGENMAYQDLFTRMALKLGVTPPSVAASEQSMKIYLFVSTVIAKLTGKRSVVTRESIQNANNKVYYDTSKIEEAIGMTWTPLDDAIAQGAKWFLTRVN